MHNWFEAGLLGFTFDPNYRTNGWFYVHLGLTDPYRIKPAEPWNSVLLHRMVRLDSNRMPILGSSVVDADAIALLDAWISGM